MFWKVNIEKLLNKMITKEQALENVKKYLKDKKRDFKNINEDISKISLEKEEIIYPYSKYYESERFVYTIAYYSEGYYGDVPIFVTVDGETGEVLFTMTEHGYAEDWED